MKLVIGAGERQTEGWTHHDVKEMPGIDIVCDIHDLHSFVSDETCEEIAMTHVLEHFPRVETAPLLKMINGFLVPDGKLYIEVPNIEYHADMIKNGADEKAEYYMFGGQLDEYDFHKTGFTYRILFYKLQEAGFTNIDIVPNATLEAKCQKAPVSLLSVLPDEQVQ